MWRDSTKGNTVLCELKLGNNLKHNLQDGPVVRELLRRMSGDCAAHCFQLLTSEAEYLVKIPNRIHCRQCTDNNLPRGEMF